ncbi:unnamed protein product [Cuscuta europaea]|uniref:Uncharacterized protein n=1 Tax=Cuscuta europaea TaxID=41803 RepID=A0A9P1E9U2_CUSEU|nr:unnamed protein product [Cuscuta europaea]
MQRPCISSNNPWMMLCFHALQQLLQQKKHGKYLINQEYVGDKKVITIRLQSLSREFENLLMKQKESVPDYISRVTGLVQEMSTLGEQLKSSQIVEKILRSLTKKYEHVVAAIKESKDLETYTFEELKGSLQVGL